MMRYLLIFLSIIGYARAEVWDTTDKVLAAASVTLIALDWGQTRWATKNPCANTPSGTGCDDPYRENGPIAKRVIGEHPSVGKVNAYFVTYIASTLLIADWLSPPNRKMFLGTITAIEIAFTAHNRSVGVKVDF
jgi:hypothetical protein